MPDTVSMPLPSRRLPAAFAGGAVIGALGGLIGLGGAEFRLPLLIGMFRFAALQAVILNKAMNFSVHTNKGKAPGEHRMLGIMNKWTWFDKLNPVSKLSDSVRLSGEMPILVAHTGIPLTEWRYLTSVISDEVLTGPQIDRAIWLVERVIKVSTRAAIGKFSSRIDLANQWGYEVFVIGTRKFWISWSDEIWLGAGKGPPDRSYPVHYNMARVQGSRWRLVGEKG